MLRSWAHLDWPHCTSRLSGANALHFSNSRAENIKESSSRGATLSLTCNSERWEQAGRTTRAVQSQAPKACPVAPACRGGSLRESQVAITHGRGDDFASFYREGASKLFPPSRCVLRNVATLLKKTWNRVTRYRASKVTWNGGGERTCVRAIQCYNMRFVMLPFSNRQLFTPRLPGHMVNRPVNRLALHKKSEGV